MIPVSSQVLEELRRVLGLGGSGSAAAAALTEFDDALLQQVFDVTPMVRRGGTLTPGAGIYVSEIRNIHSGSGTITANKNPFQLPSSAAGYPIPLPAGLDFWIFKAFSTFDTASVFTDGQLRIIYPLNQVVQSTQAADVDFPFAIWDDEHTITPSIIYGEVAEEGVSSIVQGRPVRLGRGQTLEWSSLVTAAAECTVHMLWGVFPIGLGQDIEI